MNFDQKKCKIFSSNFQSLAKHGQNFEIKRLKLHVGGQLCLQY